MELKVITSKEKASAHVKAGARKVVAPCYVTGSFRADSVIATPALTAADKEALRNGGIILG